MGEQYPIDKISPSQPDDGEPPLSSGPISVFRDGERTIIRDGNHRYWHALREGLSKIAVIFTGNPYEE